MVKLAIEKENGNKYAVKIIDKKAMSHKTEMMMREVDILKKVKHNNIIGLHALYETPHNLYLVMELYGIISNISIIYF